MRLYNSQLSGNCWKVRQILALRGIPYERIEVDVFDRSNRPRAARREEPGPARADARARRRSAPRGVERDPLVPRRRHRVRSGRSRSSGLGYSSGCSSSSTRSSRTIAVARFWITLLGEREKYAAELESKWRGGNRALGARWTATSTTASGSSATASRSPTSRSTRYTHVADEGGFDLGPYPAVQAWIDRVAAGPGTSRSRRSTAGTAMETVSVAELRRYVVAHQGYATRFRRAGRTTSQRAMRAARLRPARLDLDRRPRPPADAHLADRPLPGGGRLAAARARAGSSSTGRTRPAWSRSRTTRSSSAGWSTCASATGGAGCTTTTRR